MMMIIITRYPASEDRLIVRPLLSRVCALRLQPAEPQPYTSAHKVLRGKRGWFPKVPPWCNSTFSRSARAPSRFIDHAAWASLGKRSLERPVTGHEAPHAPLSSRIYILPRRSRRARALD